MEISKKIAQLESTTAKLEDDITKRSIKEAAVAEPEPVVAAIARDLTQFADLLQIGITSTSVTLKPRTYLGAPHFRAVSEIVRKYGGSWSSERKMFIIPKRASRSFPPFEGTSRSV
jgi:hypothetical protein